MKKILLSIIVIAIPAMLTAQTSQVEEIFEKYSGKEGYTSVRITKYMFELFAKISNEKEDKEFKDITSNLTGMMILTLDSATNVKREQDFYNEVVNSISKTEYKDLMVIKEGNEEVKFMIREKDDKISEFVMIVDGKGKAVLIVLLGDIDLKQISKLSKSMDIKGFEHLDKVDENK